MTSCRVKVFQCSDTIVRNGSYAVPDVNGQNETIITQTTYVKPVVPWSGWKVLPSRSPWAEMKENVLTVIRGVELSAANQLFPGPSAPEGQSMFLISLKPVWDDEGDPSTCTCSRGMGTRDEEKGEAPGENGTFGLLVPLKRVVPFPNDAMKEPVKKKLSPFELVVIELTSA